MQVDRMEGIMLAEIEEVDEMGVVMHEGVQGRVMQVGRKEGIMLADIEDVDEMGVVMHEGV